MKSNGEPDITCNIGTRALLPERTGPLLEQLALAARELEDRLVEREAAAERLDSERRTLETAVAALRDELRQRDERGQTLEAELGRREGEYRQEAERLRLQLAERDSAMADLRAALDEQSARADRLTQEKQAAQAETDSLRMQVKQLSYEAMVRRVKEEVAGLLPPGAKVAVISKGDEQLLDLRGRTGCHFPSDGTGRYAGYYPRDSAEAIRQLEALRGEGVQFLLLPRTAFWWLDHYGDFGRYLDAHFPRLRKTEDYQVYQLSPPDWSSPAMRRSANGASVVVKDDAQGQAEVTPQPVAAAVPTAARAPGVTRTRMPRTAYREMIGRIRSTAETVLPKEATAVVISKGDEELLNLGDRVAWHYPQTADGRYAGHHPADSADAVRQLDALRSKGGHFFIIPGTASWWLDHYDGLRRHLEENAERLWESDDCTIYQFKESPPAPQSLSPGAPSDPVAVVLARSPLDRYDAWLEVNGWSPRREADLRDRLAAARTRPLLSVIMPVYNPPPQFLEKALQTVRDQVYDHWELCVADDASTDPGVRRILREWQERDPRIKVCFRSDNGNISRATNSAVELATGEFLVLVDHDDELEPDALGEVAVYLAAHPDTDLVYTDDDKIDEKGRRYAPQFKPDWSPELLLSYMYLSHLFVLRRSLFWRAGAMRLGFEGSQDYDLALRVTELTGAVGHIPRVLYHWRALPGSTATSGAAKPNSFPAGVRAVQEALGRRSVNARVVQPDWAERAGCGIFAPVFSDDGPRVALLIPSKNNCRTLQACLESLCKTTYANYKVIVIDNESDDPETLEFLRGLPYRVVRIASPGGRFNYAAINNQAARAVEAEYILFLNDDTEVVEPRWLSQMVGYLSLEGVGAVGARLLYPDGRIQHAGVVHGYWDGQAGHAFKCLSAQETDYLAYARVARNCAAVTAACLLTRRDTFLALGGFDEENFPVAYNDVDYCHRLRQRGLRVAYCPDAELVHHESQSRGFVNDPAELARYLKKTRGMADPYYNVNLSCDDELFRIAARTLESGRPQLIPTLMCTHNLNWEGAPYHLLELTVWLKKQGGLEPLVYSPLEGPLRRKYEENGIRVEVFDHPVGGVQTLRDYEQAIDRFAGFLRKQKIEIVFGNTLETFFAIDAARIVGLPSIWNVHESEPWQTYFSRYGSEVTDRALACFNYPYQVVFAANATRTRYLPLDRHHNFTLVHYGLDRSRVEEALRRWPREMARRELRVPEGTVVVLLLGTVCERKGQLDLIEALACLHDEFAAQLSCFIVGDRQSPYSERLHTAHRALDGLRRSRVRIIPETSEIGLYFSAADLFVCTSRIESFPRVILEAMACRLPIVTTPVFGIAEQVRANVNGLFYEPGNIAGLADAIDRLIRDPDLRRRLADESVPVLETINDYDTMAAAFARILREAWMSGGPRRCVE